MDEVWKPIKGFESRYKVSSKGKVESLPRLSVLGRNLSSRPLKLSSGSGRVSLYDAKGLFVSKTIGSLVVEHFFPPLPNGFVIKYRDGFPTNGDVDNIEFVDNLGLSLNKKHRAKWDYDSCIARVYSFRKKTEWKSESIGSFDAAKKNYWIDDCMKIIESNEFEFLKFNALNIALKYKHRGDWQKGDRSTYLWAGKNGLMKECCEHMTRKKGSGIPRVKKL